MMTRTAQPDGGLVTRDKILQFLHQLLPAHEGAIDFDTDIVSSGALDSVAMVELLLWLENEKGVEIAEEEMLPENFRSISALHQFIAQSRS